MRKTPNQLALKGTATVGAISRDRVVLVSDTCMITGSLAVRSEVKDACMAVARSGDISLREELRIIAQSVNSAMKRSVAKEDGFDVVIIDRTCYLELGADEKERF